MILRESGTMILRAYSTVKQFILIIFDITGENENVSVNGTG